MKWKSCPLLLDTYEVNRNGHIRRIDTKRILIPYKDRFGYMCISTSINGKTFTLRLHRIIATLFLDNPKNVNVVNHINGIKTDNRLENLEWCTQQHNVNHAILLGLRKYEKFNK